MAKAVGEEMPPIDVSVKLAGKVAAAIWDGSTSAIKNSNVTSRRKAALSAPRLCDTLRKGRLCKNWYGISMISSVLSDTGEAIGGGIFSITSGDIVVYKMPPDEKRTVRRPPLIVLNARLSY